MTTIKVIFRASNNSEEGTLFFRIIHKRKMRQVHTGCKIRKVEWDSEAGKVLESGDDLRMAYLKSVQSKLSAGIARLSRIANEFDKSGKEYSVSDIVESYQSPDSVAGFISFAHKYISELKQIGKVRKAEHYATSLNSLERFNDDAEISFEEFNGSLVQRYEQYLIGEELIPNGISHHMRNLRAIYNQAAEQSYAGTTNPFKHVYTVIAKTVKRAIPPSP